MNYLVLDLPLSDTWYLSIDTSKEHPLELSHYQLGILEEEFMLGKEETLTLIELLSRYKQTIELDLNR